jgi:hypothetical protein
MVAGRKTGGRAPGSPNRATVERRLAAAAEEAAAKTAAVNAPPAERLAKDVIRDIMRVCYNQMAQHQPSREAPLATELFEKWMQHTLNAAGLLMPFQSPRYTAIGISVHEGPTPDGGDAAPVDYPSHDDIIRTLRARGLPPLLELLDAEVIEGETVDSNGKGNGSP